MRKGSLSLVMISCLAACISLSATAAPERFVYEKPGPGAASESKMRSVYERIENTKGTKAHARLAILRAMLATKGTAWLLEDEGDDFILGRWDYKGHTIFHRIEFDEKYVQIKYAGGLDAYQCEMQVGDYCYKTHRNYYKYNQSLVKQLRRELSL